MKTVELIDGDFISFPKSSGPITRVLLLHNRTSFESIEFNTHSCKYNESFKSNGILSEIRYDRHDRNKLSLTRDAHGNIRIYSENGTAKIIPGVSNLPNPVFHRDETIISRILSSNNITEYDYVKEKERSIFLNSPSATMSSLSDVISYDKLLYYSFMIFSAPYGNIRRATDTMSNTTFNLPALKNMDLFRQTIGGCSLLAEYFSNSHLQISQITRMLNGTESIIATKSPSTASDISCYSPTSNIVLESFYHKRILRLYDIRRDGLMAEHNHNSISCSSNKFVDIDNRPAIITSDYRGKVVAMI